MSEMVVDSTSRVRSYGNITDTKVTGIMGLSLAATAVAGAGAIGALLVLWFGQLLWLAVLLLVLTVPATWYLQSKDRNERSRAEKRLAQTMFRKAQKKGHTRYVAGPASQVPDGSFRAPGLLAATEMLEGHTTFGQPFAMLWAPRTQTGAVFIGTSSTGIGLRDQESVDQMVDAWSEFQREAGSVPSLVQVSVTTQSTADPGERLRDAVEVARSVAGAEADGSTFAREVIGDVVDELSSWTPRLDQWITLTFSARESTDGAVPARTAPELMEEIGGVLPGFCELATVSGAGAVSLLQVADVTDSTHVAFNPSAAADVERARLTAAGTGLSWEEVGPTSAEVLAKPMCYAHSGAVSKSWQMFGAPSGVFREWGLRALLEPDDRFMQKRVTVFYRPADPQSSVREVNARIVNAEFAANQKNRRVSAAEQLAVAKAKQAAQEQARGAAMVRFSILVTATVGSAGQELAKAEAAIRQKAAQGIQLRLRGCDHNDDAAFAMGLGLGIVPDKAATLSDAMRRAL
ncbi:hypothetical protein E7Z53_17140 [Kocuria salina]|uniref:SCO6880 family protein n=1 Tax=Kocuria salina TaxID=1929416 RepID=UPI001593F002|nr:SCO6880 family protein [Kocuria salina]NVC25150.1 hypothetical protein [Kocuria salina]